LRSTSTADFWTITIAHTTLTMCFVAVVVQARLLDFDTALEEAAMDSRLPAAQDLSHRDIAPDRTRHRGGLDARLHSVVGRLW